MMKKWLRRILLCIILVFVVWAGCLYSCALGNRKYNVVIETVQQGMFGPRNYVGSGVVISKDGLILTAKHLVENHDRLRVTLSDGRVFDEIDYYITATDDDVALIKLPVDVNDYVALWDSDYIIRNHVIYNIGNSRGIWDSSIFWGIVYNSKFKRLKFENCKFILAKMKTYGGCSGGGVYHYRKLIGIVVMGTPDATLIVPSNICKQVVEDYRNAMSRE